jgi:hypothetical protein
MKTNVSSRALVELVLLGPTNDRRQLQDSPVLGDVWIAFSMKPSEPMDLLITPHKSRPAGPVAVIVARRIKELNLPRTNKQLAQVAYLQGLVAARLFFKEVLRVIVPMTEWWCERGVQTKIQAYTKTDALRRKIKMVIDWAQEENEDVRAELAEGFAEFTALDRYVILAGIILWAGDSKGAQNKKRGGISGGVSEALAGNDQGPEPILGVLQKLFAEIKKDSRDAKTRKNEANIWQVSLNRKAIPALSKSVPAVKGDAARTLFSVNCRDIKWAVMDSGIDAGHPTFKDANGKSRIIKAFDFSNIRRIVSLDNQDPRTPEFNASLKELLACDRLKKMQAREATRILKELADDAANERPIHWELVEQFIEIDPRTPPKSNHGTHVAGIIGANKGAGNSGFADGMCPDIGLYDFRVLAKSVQDTEFAIIAALQYMRYLNERHSYVSIHGANLSLSIPHDVRNYACGRTPICNECERLVESGVVVVAAAGNLGYQRFETKDGSYEGYTAFSITDPGNADGVITVGATHRFRPHTYGVSFFSSRGPTGDGRLKPDLVAPGERIESSLPDGSWGELDGTSMAAPHVSGAAAMLMARYTELIGEPRRIKRILCESATDLGRERSFQGNGMLDVLRALQSI